MGWVAADNLHVTLKFLGEVDAARLDAIGEALAAATGALPAFELVVEGLGAFPSPARARVVWAGLAAGAADAAALAAGVDAALVRLGFPAEARPFAGHVTLGRVREPRRDPTLGAAIAAGTGHLYGTFRAEGVALMRSQLHPKGARYTALGMWPLQTLPGETAGRPSG